MMILVAVSVAVILRSDLLGTAKNVGTSYRGKMDAEEGMGKNDVAVTIGGQTYNSMDEYMQSICSHEWGEWEVTKEATYEEGGEKKRTCIKCNSLQQEAIAVLVCTHTYEDGECTICGKKQTSDPKYFETDLVDGELVITGIKQEYIEETMNPVTYITYNILSDGGVRITRLAIPDELPVDGVMYPVRRIGSYALDVSLDSISLPDSVTHLDTYAISEVNVIENIPKSIMYIEDMAFGWGSMTRLELPASLVYTKWFPGGVLLEEIFVDENNANYSSVDGVLYNKDKTTLIKYPEAKTDTSYVIPSTVTSVAENAFENCSNLESVELPSGLTTIGDGAFHSCFSITSIDFPLSLKVIGERSF